MLRLGEGKEEEVRSLGELMMGSFLVGTSNCSGAALMLRLGDWKEEDGRSLGELRMGSFLVGTHKCSGVASMLRLGEGKEEDVRILGELFLGTSKCSCGALEGWSGRENTSLSPSTSSMSGVRHENLLWRNSNWSPFRSSSAK